MPVGVLMIWETPRSQRLHLRQRYHVLPAFNPRNAKVWFLIDGQQRVSVLYHVRQGDRIRNAKRQDIDFSRVVFALNQQEDGQQIRYRRPTDGEYVSLSSVLHPQWKQKLNGLGPRKLARLRTCRDRIFRYDLYTMFTRGNLTDIREVFLRINTQGMKVTTADAIFSQAEALDLRDFVHAAREHLDESFNDIPDQPILFALAAIRGASEARGRALESVVRRLNREAAESPRARRSLAKDWNRLGPCFGKAVDYLRGEFAVVSREYLASDYILSILAYFFFCNRHGPNQGQKEQIRKWFWATSVGSRYSGRDFNRCVPDDLKFFKSLASNPRRRFQYEPQTERSDVWRAQFASRTAITSAVYCMLLRRRPVHFLDKGLNEIPIERYSTRANRKDRHHIFPRQVLANEGIPAKHYNSIVNACLLVAEENQKIGSKRPRHYFGAMNATGYRLNRKMARHLIPCDTESGIWDRNLKRGFGRFLSARTSLICTALEEQAGIRLFRTERRER
jgi:hypothetical protein